MNDPWMDPWMDPKNGVLLSSLTFNLHVRESVGLTVAKDSVFPGMFCDVSIQGGGELWANKSGDHDLNQFKHIFLQKVSWKF